jgi:hypothetical protein
MGISKADVNWIEIIIQLSEYICKRENQIFLTQGKCSGGDR